MQQPTVPPPTATTTTALDPAEQFAKRRKTALWFTVSLLLLSVVILVVGLVSATRTGNVAVAGHYPGIVLSFGSFLGIVGINLVENRRPMLVSSIIFVSIGVVAAFFCAIVNGIIAAEFIDMRPLLEKRCEHYSSPYSYDNYYTEVTCYSFNSKCKLRVKTNTCYCCDLHSCESPDVHSHYYEYTGVNRCSDVVHLYRLLWTSVVLNILGLLLGILTAAVLGAFKDLSPASQTSPSLAPPPHILYNPTQHMLTYAGFCPSSQALPAYPNYQLPMQHHGNYQPPTPAAPPAPEAPATPSEESQAPSQASSSYMLTPNAPVLYGMSYGPCEKPPPYAC